MCKLDAQLLRTAKRLKLIIQYGVGVEGIDIPVVCSASMPARVNSLQLTARLFRLQHRQQHSLQHALYQNLVLFAVHQKTPLFHVSLSCHGLLSLCMLSQATEQGIWVSNIPSSSTGNALSCAEHAIYLMLATLRQQNLMSEFIRRQRVGVPVGETLFGKSVLIIGFGNIAKELISRQGSCIAYWS